MAFWLSKKFRLLKHVGTLSEVIREKCSEALHIPDRFHIVAKMTKALDEVRAGERKPCVPASNL